MSSSPQNNRPHAQRPEGQPDPTKPGLMRNLGGFFGGIWAGIRADPGKTDQRRTVARRSQTQEGSGQAPDGRSVTLRRTVIEEIEVRDDRGDDRGDDSLGDGGNQHRGP